MMEKDIDVSSAVPRRLTSDLARQASMLITMGCGDECPVVPGVERDDWPLADPKGQSVERVRLEVEARVRGLVSARAWGRQ
jgi:arsenate reductase